MNNTKFKSTLYIVPSIAWAFFIFVICLIPKKSLPEAHFNREDLVVHFTAYAILSFLIIWGLFKMKIEYNPIKKIFPLLLLMGILIEVLQELLPVNRTFSIQDIAFNALGASTIFLQKKLNQLFLKWNL